MRKKRSYQLNAQCVAPNGIRLLQSIAAFFGCKVSDADAETAFIQTGKAERDVWIKPPTDSKMRSTHLLVLLVVAYGLINSNAKWQKTFDQLFKDFGLIQCQQVPQLFFKHGNNQLIIAGAEAVDYLKVSGPGDQAERFLASFNETFQLGKKND